MIFLIVLFFTATFFFAGLAQECDSTIWDLLGTWLVTIVMFGLVIGIIHFCYRLIFVVYGG